MDILTSSYQPKYVIISPVRDEKENIAGTIESVVSQTAKPALWIIVDDGSSDGTGSIIDAAAKKHSWISALHVRNRGFRQPGTGVMEAFYYGYESMNFDDWEFIVKLDGDVTFEADYFQRCFEEFRGDPRLGMGGGVMFCHRKGRLQQEPQPRFHVRGPTKIYRRECWSAIGGLIKAPGWDTVDEVKANMLGWSTRSFPDIHAIHQRPTGAAQGSWRDSVKNGRADFICGYLPLFMVAKCIKRLFQKPLLVGSAGHFYGFVTGYLKRIPQAPDRPLISYTRQQQMRRLLLQDSIWK
jgi:biofilm PGA synthesis N-glycosyltransferase PgaC